MQILHILFSFFVAAESLYSWKRYKDNNFLSLFSAEILVIAVNIWGFLNNSLLFTSPSLTYLLIVWGGWYNWKKFKEKFLIVVCYAACFALVVRIYHSFVEDALGISVDNRKLISSIILELYAILALGLIKTLAAGRK